MRTTWNIVAALTLVATPAVAEPIRLRCENLNLKRPDPTVYSILEIELENSTITQNNYYGSGSNKVPFKIIAADETMIKAVSDHEGSRDMRIDRTTGRVETIWHYRGVTLPGGPTIPAGVTKLASECKLLKPAF